MEKLEKVEVIREKCGVSYEDAKAALDACDDNVLDAIIWLEKQGKSTKQSASYTTESAAQSDVSPEMEAAQIAYQESSKKSDFSENMSSLWEKCKELFHKSVETKFIVTRRGEQFMAMPVIIPIVDYSSGVLHSGYLSLVCSLKCVITSRELILLLLM